MKFLVILKYLAGFYILLANFFYRTFITISHFYILKMPWDIEPESSEGFIELLIINNHMVNLSYGGINIEIILKLW